MLGKLSRGLLAIGGVCLSVNALAQDRSAAVMTAFKHDAMATLGNAKVLAVLNASICAHGDGKLTNMSDITAIINKTDVVVAHPIELSFLKTAANPDSPPADLNPAFSMLGSERDQYMQIGPPNIVTRWKFYNNPRPGDDVNDKRSGFGMMKHDPITTDDPNTAALTEAGDTLKKIDSRLGQNSGRNVIYVNAHLYDTGHADPTKTVTASHEYMHLILSMHGVSADNQAPQHVIIAQLGWNGPGTTPVVPGGSDCFGTGTGDSKRFGCADATLKNPSKCDSSSAANGPKADNSPTELPPDDPSPSAAPTGNDPSTPLPPPPNADG